MCIIYNTCECEARAYVNIDHISNREFHQKKKIKLKINQKKSFDFIKPLKKYNFSYNVSQK